MGEDAEALGFNRLTSGRLSSSLRYWVSGKGAGTRHNVKGWRQCWSNWLAGRPPERGAAMSTYRKDRAWKPPTAG